MTIKMHINVAFICVGLVLAGIIQAASIPAKINYQGVLKDAAGVKVDGTVDIDLRLLELGGGAAVFSESHTGVSVVGGLFSLKIGGIEDMSSVSFDKPYELELTVGGDLLSPNTPLCSAPYALGVVGGAQGPQDKQGAAGADGAAGAAGAQGPAGAAGPAGPVGSEFWDGDIGGDISSSNSGSVTVTPNLGVGYSVTPIHNTSLTVWQNGGSTQGNSRAVSLIDRDINSAKPYTEIGFGYEHSSPDRNIQPVVIGYEHTNFAGQGAGDFYVATRSSTSGEQAPAERLRVTSGGNVGIGANNPSAKLEVSGNILVTGGGADGQLKFGHNDGPDRVYVGKAGVDAFFINDNAGAMKFANGGTEAIRILANGNVGVGTTSASHKFTVQGDDGFMVRSGSTGYSGQIRLENVDGTDRSYLNQAVGNINLFNYSAGYIKLWAAGGVSHMTLESSGALTMSSGAHCTAGGTWTDASSRDLKDDIAALSLDDAVATLSGLETVTYKYKAEMDDPRVGFIAEDVPEMVATNGRKGLAPMDIVAVLTKVVQQQQQDIEALKAQLQAQP